jgi:hypothetical protein
MERCVGQLMISGPTTANKVPVPLCEKGMAERDAAINVSVLSGPSAFFFWDRIMTS